MDAEREMQNSKDFRTKLARSKIQKPITSYMHFITYLRRNIKISPPFRSFFLIYICLGVFISGFISNESILWKNNNRLHEILKIIGYITLTTAVPLDSPAFFPILYIILFFTLFDIVAFSIIIQVFQNKKHLYSIVCKFSFYGSFFMHVVLLPLTCSYYGRYLHLLYSIESSDKKSTSLDIGLSLTVVVLVLLQFTRSFFFLAATCSHLKYNDNLFLVWNPSAIVRIVLSLAFVSFISHARIARYKVVAITTFAIYFINIFFDFISVTFIHAFDTIITKIALCSAMTTSGIIIVFLFKSDNNAFFAFWCSFYSMIFICIIVMLHYFIRKKITLTKLKDKEYPNRHHFAWCVFNDLCIGLQEGQEDILNGKYFEILFPKYPNSNLLSLFAARYYVSFTERLIKYEDIALHISLSSQFDFIHMFIFGSFFMLKDETMYIYMIKKTNDVFQRLIWEIKDIHESLIEELYSALPHSSQIFDKYYRKLEKKIQYLRAMFPNAKDTRFYIDLFNSVVPTKKPIKPKLVNYIGNDIELFPSHLSIYSSNPEYFKSIENNYDSAGFTFPKEITCTSYRKKKISGPTLRIFQQWYTFFLMLICLILPAIFLVLINKQCDLEKIRATNIMNGYFLIYYYVRMTVFLEPFIAYNDEDLFWKNYISKSNFTDIVIITITTLQKDILAYSSGFGSSSYIDAPSLQEIMSVFKNITYFPLVDGNISYFSGLIDASFAAEDIVSGENVLSKEPRQTLQDIRNVTATVLPKISSKLDGIKAINKEFIKIDPIILIIVFEILCLILFVEVDWLLKKGIDDFNRFFVSLGETSKTTINKVLHEYRIMSSTLLPSKQKQAKVKVIPKIYFCYFLLVFFEFTILVLLAIYELCNKCHSIQVENMINVYKTFTSIYVNLSDTVRVVFNSSNYDLSNLTTSFIDDIWASNNKGSSFCPLCSLRQIMLMPHYYNGDFVTSYEYAIFRWFSSIILLHNKTDSYRDLLWEYIYDMIEDFSDIENNITNITMKNIYGSYKQVITVTIFYYIIALAFISTTFFIIHYNDHPFYSIVDLLSRLSETSITGNYLRGLRSRSPKNSDLNETNDMINYSLILNSLPDAVIVIDRKFKILFHNDAAKIFIQKNGDVIFNSMLIEFQTVDDNIEHSESSSDSRRFSDSSIEFEQLIQNCVFGDFKKRVSAKFFTMEERRKSWYLVSIIPLDDGSARCNFAIMFKDIGEEIRQQQLLVQETEKHFNIINQILPSQIASRLLSEQRTISMSIESIAMSFCDIVSFTPWCGSHSPDFVVSTLGKMFDYFDEMCNKYKSLTKIKCIGDCYVAAAGIFGSHDVCAKEMLEFCLDLIVAIKKVNADIGTDLQVRVGAAYGGPVSAGVLGIHKPVFDLFGDLVNEANGMESSGKPMRVHISKKLYKKVFDNEHVFEPKGDGTYFVTRFDS